MNLHFGITRESVPQLPVSRAHQAKGKPKFSPWFSRVQSLSPRSPPLQKPDVLRLRACLTSGGRFGEQSPGPTGFLVLDIGHPCCGARDQWHTQHQDTAHWSRSSVASLHRVAFTFFFFPFCIWVTGSFGSKHGDICILRGSLSLGLQKANFLFIGDTSIGTTAHGISDTGHIWDSWGFLFMLHLSTFFFTFSVFLFPPFFQRASTITPDRPTLMIPPQRHGTASYNRQSSHLIPTTTR